MPLLELNPGRKNSWRWLPILLFFSVLVTFLGLRTVLASNITTNGGNPINFGQGVTTVTSCSGKESIIITPKVSFVNNSKTADAFYFSSVTVANIPATCYGKDFQLNAYDSNGTTSPLAPFSIQPKKMLLSITIMENFLLLRAQQQDWKLLPTQLPLLPSSSQSQLLYQRQSLLLHCKAHPIAPRIVFKMEWIASLGKPGLEAE